MPTKIEWASKTWNPIKMRCTPVSEGCQNCYAASIIKRNLLKDYPRLGELPRLDEKTWERLFHWRKPQRILVESMGDLFHEDVRDIYVDMVFFAMAQCKQHTFLLLTKRPERARDLFLNGGFGQWKDGVYLDKMKSNNATWKPLPNVWLGVTAENQRTADERIPILLQIPAAVHFVSVEPMLEPVDLSPYLKPVTYTKSNNGKHGLWGLSRGVDWVICGPETGLYKRPFDMNWAGDLYVQCRDAGVPFFAKKYAMVNARLSGEYPEKG